MQRRSPSNACSYRIRVEGHLDASWSARLGGMAIELSLGSDQGQVSTLTGLLPDQCALSGVLNALVDRQHAVISVRRLGDHSSLEP